MVRLSKTPSPTFERLTSHPDEDCRLENSIEPFARIVMFEGQGHPCFVTRFTPGMDVVEIHPRENYTLEGITLRYEQHVERVEFPQRSAVSLVIGETTYRIYSKSAPWNKTP